MNLQEIDEVMQSAFWKEYTRLILEKHKALTHSFRKDSIAEEKQWLRHVKYQGELDSIDWVLRLPEDMIKAAKGTLG